MNDKSNTSPYAAPVQLVSLQSMSKSEGEIDLMGLFRTIWGGRNFIVALVVGFVVVMFLISLYLPRLYKSEAVFLQPTISQFREIIPSYSGVFEISEDKLFDQFALFVGGEFLKRRYFEDRVLPKLDIATGDDVVIDEAFTKLRDQIVVNYEFGVGEGVQLQVYAETPKSAKLLLNDYVLFANNAVLKQLQRDFDAVVASKVVGLQREVDGLRREERVRIKSRVRALEDALALAKELKIDNPSQAYSGFVSRRGLKGEASINMIEAPLYSLGVKLLGSEIDKLKARNDVDLYIEEIPKLLSDIEEIESLRIVTQDKTVYFVETEALIFSTPVKPNLILLLIIAALVGGGGGVLWVIARSMVKNTAE